MTDLTRPLGEEESKADSSKKMHLTHRESLNQDTLNMKQTVCTENTSEVRKDNFDTIPISRDLYMTDDTNLQSKSSSSNLATQHLKFNVSPAC